MRMSSLFLRTLRDDPADAEVDSHKLLVRAGCIRRVSSGIYSWLPLGNRVLRNVAQIVREEMDAAGAQEVTLPIAQPLDLWKQSGRDELRPRFGLLRAREFLMKDAYSFDADLAGLQASYEKMYDAYTRVFTRCGL